METNPKIEIDLRNPSIQSDISWVSPNNQSIGNLSLLNVHGKDSPDVMLMSVNYSSLNSELSPNVRNIAFMSNSTSDAICSFSNCYVEAVFSGPKDFFITTINFGYNYPKKIRIDYYNSNGSLIDTETIDEIDSQTIFSSVSIVGCKRMRMTFLESWFPFRVASLQEWLIGAILVFEKDSIVKLNLNEDVDPISRSLTIDNADVELIPIGFNFDITSTKGINRYLIPGTKVKISTKIIENDVAKDLYLGTYFIKSSGSTNNQSISFNCETILGTMDKFNFYWFQIQESMRVGDVIRSIFGACNITEYEIESSIDNLYCHGYIPVMSCRDALKQVCFAFNLTVFDNRDEKIRVKKFKQDIQTENIIEYEYVTAQPTYSRNQNIKSISIKSCDIQLDSAESDVVTDITQSGQYIFSEPTKDVHIVRTSSQGYATFGTAYVTFATVDVIFPGTFKIVGQVYREKNVQEKVYNYAEDGENISIEDCKLVNSALADSIVQNVKSFYENNELKIDFEYICTGQEVGTKVSVNLGEKTFVGYLIHHSLDVAGGMVANAEIVGDVS